MKNKSALKKNYLFIEIEKLTGNTGSNVSNLYISFYLQKPMPLLHTEFLRIISRNPENVQTVCIDRNNPFHFACP